MLSQSRKNFCALMVALNVISVMADPNDWVNPSYVLKSSKDGSTASARNTIVKNADARSRQRVYTVSDSKAVKAPSGSVRDYLSWAPYHWPDCNWCTKSGKNHFASGSNTTDNGDTGEPSDADPEDSDSAGPTEYDPLGDEQNGGDNADTPLSSILPLNVGMRMMRRRVRRSAAQAPEVVFSVQNETSLAVAMSTTSTGSHTANPTGVEAQIYVAENAQDVSLPTDVRSITLPLSAAHTSSSHSDDRVINGTPTPAQNGAHTKTAKGHSATAKASCTPSPTKSLAPSATWTTCPYVTRDGKVNPDVRQLHGVNAVNGVTQAVIYEALAYAFTKTTAYSKSAAQSIETFFLDPKGGMNPALEYGQVIRGPGQQHGQYLGILDFRGMVKVVNAIQILKNLGSPDWTSARESKMQSWVQQYSDWLQTSALGKKAGKSANNHASFYHNQLAALKIYTGDTGNASAALTNYFKHQFLDQIAASGEQPFEAVRTRPFHYRCFNLEAMITNAKLGDQIGLDFWSAKSKYRSTIKTAVDFLMRQNPREEDVTEILPHVAAVAAAYGDPDGKYAAFLKRIAPSHQAEPFFFFDQLSALPSSPAAKGRKASKRADIPESIIGGDRLPLNETVPNIPFECPAVFALAEEVQLDDGVFVTCVQLKPFYGYIDNV
ncbi:chondroitin AC/alginate lyase [Rickenella mellea]|uniref:Chondroitin AC/alginate lyase n=1 Tax=Rickenella mellea TaxID=50990 RepID=A0A4Y7PYJ7_9AGAM|nr:chondroitin AC/alginate lyase [Rickenella mellea]